MLDEKKQYLIQWSPDLFVIGKFVRTRGNDEEFPHFLVDHPRFPGGRIGVSIKSVIGTIEKGENEKVASTQV